MPKPTMVEIREALGLDPYGDLKIAEWLAALDGALQRVIDAQRKGEEGLWRMTDALKCVR